MASIVTGAPRTIFPGTSAGGTDDRYLKHKPMALDTRAKRKKAENLLVSSGYGRVQARQTVSKANKHHLLVHTERSFCVIPLTKP